MEPGIYANIPEDEYHASEGISKSRLAVFSEAPAKARYGHIKETPAMRFGSLIHTAVLEPDALDARFYVSDLERFDTRTVAYKDEVVKAAGRELVKRADYNEALRIQDAVHAHPTAAKILAPSLLVEQSFYWVDEETGLLRRGRTDGLRPDMQILVDLKSTDDASPGGFARTCAKYRYHWQDAYYRDGIKATCGWTPDTFVFIAVEKEAPWLVGCYELEDSAVERGRDDVRDQLRRYAECLKSDVWPGYSDHLETLTLPKWAYA